MIPITQLWPFAVAAGVIGALAAGAYRNRNKPSDLLNEDTQDRPEYYMDPERERSGHLMGRQH
jgi:hypothetical protein